MSAPVPWGCAKNGDGTESPRAHPRPCGCRGCQDDDVAWRERRGKHLLDEGRPRPALTLTHAKDAPRQIPSKFSYRAGSMGKASESLYAGPAFSLRVRFSILGAHANEARDQPSRPEVDRLM
jgi:hypothetical protein